MNKKPNILIFMTDQQNGRTISGQSHHRAKTPHLDAYRKKAVSFTNAFSPSPHCCPSRVSFFTGRYPSEHGVWNNVNVSNALTRGPRDNTPFWSNDLKKAGYDLAFAGKWHVSNWQTPSNFGWYELLVTSPGFGSGLSLEAQREEARSRELRVFDGHEPHSGSRRPGEVIRPGWPGYLHYGTADDPFGDGQVVDSAIQHMRGKLADGTDPWCMYVGTLGPHDPYTPPQEFLDLYDPDEITLPSSFSDTMDDKPGLYSRTRDRFDQLTQGEHREALRHYLAFCSYEDALFGRLLETLAETEQAEDTIVLYLSDHGDYAAEHGLWGKGLPSFQSAYRVPLVVGGPCIDAVRQGQDCERPTSLVELGETIKELTSGTGHAQELTRFLTQSEPPAATQSDVFFQSNGNEAYGVQRAVMSDGWKLVYNMFDHDELYNLNDDPEEVRNLLVKPKGQRELGRGPLDVIPKDLHSVVETLYKKLWTFGLSHNDENINDYILTALAPFGPGIARRVSSTEGNGT